MSVKQISVFLENRAGAMQGMTAVLAEHGVDMRALSLAETNDFGIVRLIVDDVYAASTVLKEAGYSVEDVVETTVMLSDIADFAAMNEVYAKHFTQNCPARCAFQVAALPRNAKVEIRAVACK